MWNALWKCDIITVPLYKPVHVYYLFLSMCWTFINLLWNWKLVLVCQWFKRKKRVTVIVQLIFQSEVKVAKDFPFFRFLFLVLLESLSSCLNEFPFNLLSELLDRWSLLKNSGYHCNCKLICFCGRRLGPSIQERDCLLKVVFQTNDLSLLLLY